MVKVGYNLYVFDIRHQQLLTASQPIKVEIIFDGVVPNDVNRYALVLTNKLVSVNSDGQKHFDLIEAIFNFFITMSFSFLVNFVIFSKVSL